MTPAQYFALEKVLSLAIFDLEEAISTAARIAHHGPTPTHLRPATIDDIKAGAILWYNNFDKEDRNPEGWGWKIVIKVINQRGDYEAEDDCYYDLDGAHIETTE